VSGQALQHRFVADVLTNPVNAALLARWDDLAPTHSIRDYDLFSFDASGDADAERAVQARVEALTADLGVRVEAVNQARVHLWYEQDFGYPCMSPRPAPTRRAGRG